MDMSSAFLATQLLWLFMTAMMLCIVLAGGANKRRVKRSAGVSRVPFASSRVPLSGGPGQSEARLMSAKIHSRNSM